ncbi:hypothetical protein B0O99DRAFT_630663 [Bisporella sp. PMI_857]|nr:hypothetical protein B0O99DRAFT_630663 [Bisporella sp. PMI_857]
MKTVMFTSALALCTSVATAGQSPFDRRQSGTTANLQFETNPNEFRGNNPVTMGQALDTKQKLFSISVGKTSGDEKEVLCQAFNGTQSVGVFFSSRDVKFAGAGGQDITRIECDLPKFPVKAQPPASSSSAPTATSSAARPTGTSGSGSNAPPVSGPTITFQFETEFATTFTQQTFPFGTVLDVDIKLVSARITEIKDANGNVQDASKVVCKTQRDQSSQSAGDITSLDKTFFDRRNQVRITQISCSGLDGRK